MTHNSMKSNILLELSHTTANVASRGTASAACGARPSMDEVDGPGGVEVAERVNDLKAQERAGSETTFVSFNCRLGTAVRQENNKNKQQSSREIARNRKVGVPS